MVSYSSVQGTPCHLSKPLLDRLRSELGFEGIIVSDFDALEKISSISSNGTGAGACTGLREVISASLNAGVDMVMTSGGMYGGTRLQEQLGFVKEAVASGTIPAGRIDEAVRRIARAKFLLGLAPGATPPVDPASFHDCVGCAEHREVARQAVAHSLVLLVNRDDVLPLDPHAAGSVIVVGAGAHDLGMQCGGWSGEWQGSKGNSWTRGTTLWEGVRTACPTATLHIDPSQAQAAVHFAPPSADGGGPLAIFICGEPPYAEGGGDVHEVALSASDGAVVDMLADHGARVVLLLLSGRPLAIAQCTLERIWALVACWLPGTEGGGVADVLFGARPFSGKTSFAWPRQPHHGRIEERTLDPLFACGSGLATKPWPPSQSGVSVLQRDC